MKVEVSYSVKLYYDSVDLTEEAVDSMNVSELEDFVHELIDEEIPDNAEEGRISFFTFKADDGREIITI